MFKILAIIGTAGNRENPEAALDKGTLLCRVKSSGPLLNMGDEMEEALEDSYALLAGGLANRTVGAEFSFRSMIGDDKSRIVADRIACRDLVFQVVGAGEKGKKHKIHVVEVLETLADTNMKLVNEMENLKKRVTELEERLHFMPGIGLGYMEAASHFSQSRDVQERQETNLIEG